jgi:hypothetical protein
MIFFHTIAGIIKFLSVVNQVSKYSNTVIGKGNSIDSPYPIFPNSSVSFIIMGFRFFIVQKDTVSEFTIGISSTRISAFTIRIITKPDYFG